MSVGQEEFLQPWDLPDIFRFVALFILGLLVCPSFSSVLPSLIFSFFDSSLPNSPNPTRYFNPLSPVIPHLTLFPYLYPLLFSFMIILIIFPLILLPLTAGHLL